ncbi:prepilin peptidase [Corynebacterium mastitidis]
MAPMWGTCTGVWLCALAWADLRHGRLPDALTLPGAAAWWAWAVVHHPPLLLGGAAWALLYLGVGLWSHGVGGGDVKLAAGLGVMACLGGARGWCVAVAGASAISLAVMLVTRRASVPHGPSMILSALCAATM